MRFFSIAVSLLMYTSYPETHAFSPSKIHHIRLKASSLQLSKQYPQPDEETPPQPSPEDENLTSALSAALFQNPPINRPRKRRKRSKAKTPQEQQNEEDQKEIPMVPAGTTSDIFAMARRMLLWDSKSLNDSSFSAEEEEPALPRWRPHSGVSDSNPDFRTSTPKMTSIGYANTIQRNARKKNKPRLWEYALRTYHKMSIPKMSRHHEAAMEACAKLGSWKEAFQIWKSVEEDKGQKVTDNMVLALIKAASRSSRRKDLTLEDRRESLDVVKEVLCTLEEKHSIPLVSRHINPLASAYQSLNLHSEAELLLHTMLNDPISQTDASTVNVKNIGAKDSNSYSLLVQGAIMEEDWSKAVERLTDMTSVGVYPKQTDLNTWAEVSEKKNGKGWKKRREGNWIKN